MYLLVHIHPCEIFGTTHIQQEPATPKFPEDHEKIFLHWLMKPLWKYNSFIQTSWNIYIIRMLLCY